MTLLFNEVFKKTAFGYNFSRWRTFFMEFGYVLLRQK